MLRIVSQRPVRGGIEKTYTVVEESVHLKAEPGPPDRNREVLRFVTFVGTLVNGFARYIETPGADMMTDGVGYSQVPLWLDGGEMQGMAVELRNVVEKYRSNKPGSGKTKSAISLIIYPDLH